MSQRRRRCCHVCVILSRKLFHPPRFDAKPHTFVRVGREVAVKDGLHAQLCRGVQRSLHADHGHHRILPPHVIKTSTTRDTKK